MRRGDAVDSHPDPILTEESVNLVGHLSKQPGEKAV